MEAMLTNLRIDGVNHPLTIAVSHAFENFDDVSRLEATIEAADAKMYRQKQSRKTGAAPQFMPSLQAESSRRL